MTTQVGTSCSDTVHQKFHSFIDEADALDKSAKRSNSSFQSLTQLPSKDEVKPASKHKVVSEELNDKGGWRAPW